MPNDSKDRTLEIDMSNPVNRRKILTTGGSLALLGLAGCGGDGGATRTLRPSPTPKVETVVKTVEGGEETVVKTKTVEVTREQTETDTEGVPDQVDQTFTAAMQASGSDVQFNVKQENRNPKIEDFIREPLVRLHPVTKNLVPILVDDLNVERINDTTYEAPNGTYEGDIIKVTGKLKQGLQWHDGDDFTAQDVTDQYKLTQYQWYPEQVVTIEAQALSDREFRFVGSGQSRTANRHVIGFLGTINHWGHPKYEEGLKRLKEIGADFNSQWGTADPKKHEKTVKEIFDFTIPPEEVDQVGYGLFKPLEFTTEKVRFEPFESHPLSDQINYDEVVLNHLPRQEGVGASLQSGRLTTNSGQWNDVLVNSIPDKYDTYQPPAFSDTAIRFNMGDPHVGRINVRHALLYLMDRKRIAEVRQQIPVAKPSIFWGNASNQPQKRSQGYWDDLKAYDFNAEKGAQMLKQAGYTKKNGQWQTPEGDQFKLNIIAPAGDSSVTQTLSIMSDMWSQQGISTQLSTMDSATFNDRHGRHDYQIAYSSKGVLRAPRIIASVWLQFIGSGGIRSKDAPESTPEEGTPGPTFLERVTTADLKDMSREEFWSNVEPKPSGELSWWEQIVREPTLEYMRPIASSKGSSWVFFAYKTPYPPQGFPKRDFFVDHEFWDAANNNWDVKEDNDFLWIPQTHFRAGGKKQFADLDEHYGVPYDVSHRGARPKPRKEMIDWMNLGYNYFMPKLSIYENTTDLFINSNRWTGYPKKFQGFTQNDLFWSDDFLAKHVLKATG